MTEDKTGTLGLACALTAAIGWGIGLLVFIIVLPPNPEAFVSSPADYLAWAQENAGRLAAMRWFTGLASLVAIGAILATTQRLRDQVPALLPMAQPAAVSGLLLIAVTSLAQAVVGPIIGDAYVNGSPETRQAALLLHDVAVAVSGLWLGTVGLGLLGIGMAFLGLAILRSGDLNRPLGWMALLVSLLLLTLAVVGALRPPMPLPSSLELLSLVLLAVWFLVLARSLTRPQGPARQRWLWKSRRQPSDLPDAQPASLGRSVEQPALHPAWKRGITWCWRLGLTPWMVWLKRPFSRVINLTRPAVTWQPLAFGSLDEVAGWLQEHVRWVPDPLGGVLDFSPSLGHAAWQLIRTGQFMDDCDGLAYLSSSLVEPFCDLSDERYLITVLIDPWDVGWANAAHVMLFFRQAGEWRIVSNHVLYQPAWETLWEALQDNPYVGGRPIFLAVIQDANWRTLWWGRPGPDDGRPAALR